MVWISEIQSFCHYDGVAVLLTVSDALCAGLDPAKEVRLGVWAFREYLPRQSSQGVRPIVPRVSAHSPLIAWNGILLPGGEGEAHSCGFYLQYGACPFGSTNPGVVGAAKVAERGMLFPIVRG